MLVNYLTATFGTGMHSRRGIEQIIRGYCGDKLSVNDIKSSMRVGYLQAVALRDRGYAALDKLHSHTMDALWREMEESELLVIVA
jgi:hypothetical protein